MTNKKIKICFITSTIYPLLKKKQKSDFIGGAELQQLLIGEELVKRGHRVSYMTLDHGQGLVAQEGDFQIIATYKPGEGVPFLRFFYPRLPKLWSALCRSDADIYYLRCAGFLIAPVTLWCRLNRRKVMFCGANDPDFDPDKLKLSPRDKFLFFWGLKRCDAVVVQNKKQQELLKRNFGRQGVVISNGFAGVNGMIAKGNFILWVATIKPHKRPEIFIELAKRFPNERFIMVGGMYKRQKSFYEGIVERAKTVPNLEFKGFLPLEEVEKLFTQTKVFVNTSEHEGFPNTFLQAWRRGIPVLSLLDPDHLLSDNPSLGKFVPAPVELDQGLKDILNQPDGERAVQIKKFFDENFLIEKVVDRYEELFRTM